MYGIDSTLTQIGKGTKRRNVTSLWDMMMIQSVDFITPIVDDPYIYGQIAAANAMSDIFAMGAEARTALNLLMWDRENVDKKVLAEILRGGIDKLNEADCMLLGGHSVVDREQKYGLCVTGFAKRIWQNHTPQVGDALVLSKPIGSGVITTALKNGVIPMDLARDCLDSMARLNLEAMRVASEFDIHAATDITGFGLLGHLSEMCVDVVLELWADSVPLFDGTQALLDQEIFPGGSRANLAHFKDFVDGDLSGSAKIFCDAQTSGGIVFALPFLQAEKLLDKLRYAGYEYANIIGRFTNFKEDTKRIFLK